jgi:hypothetical protein
LLPALRRFGRFTATAILALILPACHGSASVLPTAAPSHGVADRSTGVVAFVISDYFPKSDTRRAHYFPKETLSLLIRIGDRESRVHLSPLSPQCQISATHIKCVVKVNAAQGRTAFTVTALDYGGQPLAAATGTANIGAQTNIPLTLRGIAARATVSLKSTAVLGKPSNLGLSINAYDVDGGLIVGNAPFDKPLQLKNSDKSGVFRLSDATVWGPQSTVALRYNGGLANTNVSIKPPDPTQAVVPVYPQLAVKTYHVGKSTFSGSFLIPGSLTVGTKGDMAVAYYHGFATVSPAGRVTHHSSHLPIASLAAGPDGAYWMGRSKCDFPSSDCKVTYVSRFDGTYSDVSVSAAVTSIVRGPDEKLWALAGSPETVFAIDAAGTVQTYAVPDTISLRTSNVVAPADGNVWFYDRGGSIGNSSDRFVVVAPDGRMTPIDVRGSDPGALALSPDKKTIWVPESFYGGIGKMEVATRKFQTIPNVPIQFSGNVIPAAASAVGLWVEVQRPRYTLPYEVFLGFVRPDGSVAYVGVPTSKEVSEITSLCFAADGRLWFATDTAVGTISLGK